MKEKINFVFWGTPECAAKTLEILKKNGFSPSLIISTFPKTKNRERREVLSPVFLWGQKNNIEVICPEKLDANFKEKIFSLKGIDLFIVIAYGKILTQDLLDFPKHGCLNVHYSLLPKYRGPSPVEFALLNGEKETGVTIQKMELKLDSGPIIAQEKVKIDFFDNYLTLLEKLTFAGGDLLVKTIIPYLQGEIKLTPQNENQVTWSRKIKKEDGEIFQNESELMKWNKYRAFYKWPGTYFFVTKNGKKIRILIKEADWQDEKFIIKKVLPEGRKAMEYSNFLKNFLGLKNLP